MEEDVIIKQVVKNLKAIAGVDVVVETTTHHRIDYRLKIEWEQELFPFEVEVRKEIRRYQLPQLMAFKKEYQYFLLVAQKLFPNVRQELQEAQINYIEANGNMFIHRPGLHVVVDGKPPLEEEKNGSNKAFTRTGLKVIFQLLQKQDLLNATQRAIAIKAGVALGNIPGVLEGLLQAGYMVKETHDKLMWVNKKELLARWITDYNTNLKPTLLQKRFELPDNVDWREIKFDADDICWGGEPGADLLTNYLNPGKYTIYTNKQINDLIIHYRWKPSAQGNLWVYEKFWTEPAINQCAPPLLVYADLMGVGGKRALETADLIYDKYVANL